MIYYVEDDENIRELVVYTLNQTGLEAEGLEDSAALDAALSRRMPELVLLDIMLPDEDGLSILRRLRAESDTADIPVIMVTAKGAEYDKVRGLDSGADDYIAKPFGMAEMVARVKARLRRAPRGESDGALVSGELRINARARIVTVDDAEISLTRKEYELLECLMKNPGVVFTREQLLGKIWDYGYDGGTRTVDVHVQTLRAKLGKPGERIETVRGVGYRFGGR